MKPETRNIIIALVIFIIVAASAAYFMLRKKPMQDKTPAKPANNDEADLADKLMAKNDAAAAAHPAHKKTSANPQAQTPLQQALAEQQQADDARAAAISRLQQPTPFNSIISLTP